MVVPLADHGDADADHELGVRVAQTYAGTDPVHALTSPSEVERTRDPFPPVIQAIVDQNEPLLPAVVSESYAEHLKQALDQGTKGAAEIGQALEREPSRSMMGDRSAPD